MKRVLALVGARVAGDLLVAHASGLVLLALILSAEAADLTPAQLWDLWVDRIPSLWAQASPMLTVAGTSLGLLRMRRDGIVLALGTFGVTPRVCLGVGAALGLVVGLAAAGFAGHRVTPHGADWVRAEGGWYRDGVAVPDEVGGEVHTIPSPPRPVWTPALTGGAAGLAGAALGLWTAGLATVITAVVVLVGNTLAQGLVARAALPPAAAWVPTALLVVGTLVGARFAPLFPRRWG